MIEPLKKTRIPEEIANRVRRLILDGTFKPGEPLPSERQLARSFGVSRGSVRDAFRMLETIGLLETRHGQGTGLGLSICHRIVTSAGGILTAHENAVGRGSTFRVVFPTVLADEEP